MKKSLLLTLGLISSATAASILAKALTSKKSLLTSNIISSKTLKKQIVSSQTIGLVLSTKTGFTTVSGPTMKKILKQHSKAPNSSIVGTIASTKKGMNTSVSKKFATSSHLTSNKHLKMTAGTHSVAATSGMWNKKSIKSPLSMKRLGKDGASASSVGIKLSSGQPKFYKI